MTAPDAPAAATNTTERLFIALSLPEAVRTALLPLVEPIHGLTWTRPEQMHVTLRFLGDVRAEEAAAMADRLAQVQVAPFVLPMEGLGTFPPNRPPRVLWLGVGAGHPRLFQLRQRIDDAVLGAGIDLDVRTFHPHVTLARCTESVGPALAHWMHAHREFVGPSFRVESFDLYASELRPSGAVHTLKRRFPLATG
ncbi:RNA 2',3'-cyclic phosphodiesterase [Opitutus sp. ER46]|uniref:RNA 2',3'-cyclic phosphodiesterase n=1 Tax=Opitutus sp. ER46 TaxID=2161864 RepID=UPI0011B2110D|nr:RNA 2',3'-cyclic phosphodiesterase [Opitutus sp. ER46]